MVGIPGTLCPWVTGFLDIVYSDLSTWILPTPHSKAVFAILEGDVSASWG
jgi:hypothetical protein